MRAQPARALSNLELLAELKKVYELVGKSWLTSTDFDAHSITNRETIRQRFGSFRNALKIAGIPNAPQKARQFTDAQCFENLAEVWTYFGRPPEYREMFREPSNIQGKTYVLRWGTWRKALAAFVEWANSEEQAQPGVQVEESYPKNDSLVLKALPEPDSREVRPGLRFRVFMRDRFRCVACGRSPATDFETILHADHILAVANGGKTTFENLQTLCQKCNLGKGRAVLSV